VIGGSDCLEDRRMKDMFVGAAISYNVETCQMVSTFVVI
jgi:hypothetical protein